MARAPRKATNIVPRAQLPDSGPEPGFMLPHLSASIATNMAPCAWFEHQFNAS